MLHRRKAMEVPAATAHLRHLDRHNVLHLVVDSAAHRPLPDVQSPDKHHRNSRALPLRLVVACLHLRRPLQVMVDKDLSSHHINKANKGV
jgi:hypothetical protein